MTVLDLGMCVYRFDLGCSASSCSRRGRSDGMNDVGGKGDVIQKPGWCGVRAIGH